MMKRYGYWKAIALSFYSKDLYRDIRENWGGNVVICLLLVLALTWLPLLYGFQIKINQFLPQFLTSIAAQSPEINIKKGIVTTPENRPYFIKDLSGKHVIAIIDTSGKYTNLETTSADVLLTKNALMTRTSSHATTSRMQNFSPELSYKIIPANLAESAIQWSQWFWLMIFPLCLFFSWLYRLMQAVLFAAIGKVLVLTLKTNLSYGKICKIMVIALIPAIIINAIIMTIIGSYPHQWLVDAIISIFYLLFGIKANEKERGLV